MEEDIDYMQLLRAAMSARAASRASAHASPKPPRSASKGSAKSRGSPSRGKSKSPLRSKSASSKASNSKDDAAESATSKAGSATLRRVTLRSADITQRGLKTVDKCGQGMTVVNSALFQEKDVGILDLSSNNLRSLPPDMKKLQKLVHIDLSRNGIRCTHNQDFGGLPAELSLLPDLEVIIISECNLPFVPPAIWKCKHLKVLDISRNKINILPPDIGNLEQLEHLNAQQTNISTLPPEIAYCQALEDVLLWGNVIDSLPDTMREMGSLKTLAINNRSFTQIVDNYMDNLLRKGQIQSEHIPPVLFEIPSLDILDLEETKVNALPDKCVCRLREFFLGKNYFQSVPKMIQQLDSLEILDLSDNLITELPAELGNLKNLTLLRLNNNAFVTVPPSIGQLVKLQELAMGGNRIQALPNSVGNLKELKIIIMDRNELKALPDTLVQLEELETLDLTQNQITTLPINFHMMKKLNTAHTYNKFHKFGLWLHLNPLTTPPETVWKTEDPSNIYNYMKKLQIKRTENLQRQKLVILGEAQCGKTSLLQTMSTGKSFMTAGSEESTEVIDFVAWKTDNLVDFLIHDVGGDDVYKTTTPLFMDPKALYLLVYDHRKYSPEKHYNAIGYWMDLLYMYAPGAIVKLVGTQCDQSYPDFVEKTKEHVREQLDAQIKFYEEKITTAIQKIGEMLKKPEEHGLSEGEMNNLKKQKFRLMMLKRAPLRVQGDVALVSCADGISGIPQLITDIELIAVNKDLFPHAQRHISQNWVDFRMTLKMRRDNFLSMDIIKVLAKKHNIVKENLDNCLKFFKDIGEILWYDNIPALKEIVFQRPRALIHILKGLFTHRLPDILDYEENRIFASKGQFSAEMFETNKNQLEVCGEISRPMLLCLWFYLQLDSNLLEDLLDLLPRLDLCYTIPQPDVPPRKSEFFPLMVIPYYNEDPPPEDTDDIWPDDLHDDLKEVELTLTFPLLYPNGLFERLSCRLQEQLTSRLDWRDLILTEFFSGKMLISRELHPTTYDCVIRIRIRGEDVNFLKNTMAFVYRELGNLLSLCPGLVWYKNFHLDNCGDLGVTDCFPREVMMSD